MTSDAQFEELKERIAPVCKRTLRSQVREYVAYTDRICLTREFSPNNDEYELYESVSEYLRKETLYALPKSQRMLMTLIFRKILASSSFAIADTLKGLANKLKNILARHSDVARNLFRDGKEETIYEELGETRNKFRATFECELEESTRNEFRDADDDFDEDVKEEKFYTEKELAEIREEMAELEGYYQLAHSIKQNSKGENLIIALKAGFDKMRELGAAEKAVIFTESVRTQKYIREILEQNGYKGKIVLFNGSNNDADSTRIYQNWLQKHKGTERISGSRAADIRGALTEYFRDEAEILIATEAAAEGINLQFCSLVVNYDMPWNPQRIEQRIGRCHRYGQRFNVVVVNFLNNRNAADKRVYELLEKKFFLFGGVFGASDEILGSIENGVDFEKRIIQIYQSCRTETEIQAAFNKLQEELEDSIAQRLDHTHQQLMENFDEEVLEKIKMESESRLDTFEQKFWNFSHFALTPYANNFDDQNFSFRLLDSPTPSVSNGNFRFLSHRLPFDRLPKDAQIYRYGHPLAKYFFQHFQTLELPCAKVVFDITNSPIKVSTLEKLVGTEGWLRLDKLTVDSLEVEDYLLFSGMDEDGLILEADICKRFFSCSAELVPRKNNDNNIAEQVPRYINDALEHNFTTQKHQILTQRQQRDMDLFSLEMTKLDRWADDQRLALQTELRELEQDIRLRRNLARQSTTLAERVKEQRHITDLERKLADKRFRLHGEEDNIEVKKNKFLDDTEKKLDTRIEQISLFTLRWKIV